MMYDVTKEFIAGGAGGIAGLIVGHPCDTMKTITQNSVTGSTPGIRELSKMMMRIGSQTFFRGLSVPFWSYGVVNAVFFGVEKNIMKAFKLDLDQELSDEGYYYLSMDRSVLLMISGSLAGAAQLIPAVPGEVIKIRMQMDAHTTGAPPKVRQTIQSIYQEMGLRGFYTGCTASLLREVPASATYFFTYEYSRRLLRRNTDLNDLSNSFTSGAFAGWVSWMLTMPQDVIKTRIQSGLEKNISGCIKRLLAEGPRSFYKGLTLVSIRALLFNGFAFWGYEVCMLWMK